MSSRVPNVYIIASDATGFALRKLKGLASSLGIKLHVIHDPKALPTSPDDNSLIIVRDNIKIPFSENHDTNWHKIFLVSAATENSASGRLSQIIIAPGAAAVVSNPQLFYAILTLYDISLSPTWHLSVAEGECPAPQIKTILANWAASLKMTSYPLIQSLLNGIQTNTENLSDLKVRYRFRSDGHGLNVIFDIETESKEVLKSIRKSFVCPEAHIDIYHEHSQGCRVIVASEFNGLDKVHLRLIDVDIDDKDTEHRIETKDCTGKEAS